MTVVIAVMVTATVFTPVAADTVHARSVSATSMPDTGVSGGGSAAMGPGISVKEARHTRIRGLVLVVGYLLVVRGDPVRLCDALSRARIRRCTGVALEVRGLPSGERKRLADVHRSGSPTRWSSRPVRILGNIRKTTLVVSTTARA